MTRILLLFTFLTSPLPATDWPQWMGPGRDGVWREDGLCEKFPDAGPKVLWEAKCGGGYAGPAVADGRVFIPDRLALLKPPKADAIPGTERLLCLDANTGRELWNYTRDCPVTADYSAGPRSTPTVHDGRVYFLGIHGRLACLECATGTVIWERELEKDFHCKAPAWGFAGHPLVYQDTLLCTTAGDGSCLAAFDLKTGAVKWKSLTDKEPGYSSPFLADCHGQPLIIQWTGNAIHGVDPANGKELWSLPWSIKYGVAIASPRQSGDTILLSSYWWGSKLLRLKPGGEKPDIVWETERESESRTTHLNSLLCTPILREGHLYGVCNRGQLRALEWQTGTRCWEDKDIICRGKELRNGTAFLTWLNDTDRALCFTENGELLILRLTPEKCEVLTRAQVIPPDCPDVKERPVVWTHPAYANKRAYVRNNSIVRCVDLSDGK